MPSPLGLVRALKERVLDGGGAAALTSAMNAHASTPAVVLQALVALANLAAGTERCKSGVIAAGGLSCCAHAMVASGGSIPQSGAEAAPESSLAAIQIDAQLQLQALRLLANVSTSAQGTVAVLSSGGVPATAQRWLPIGMIQE